MPVFQVTDGRRRAAALVLVTALVAGGCSGGGDDPGSEPADSPTLVEPGEAPTFAVEPVTTPGRLVGRLPRKERRRVEQAVSRVALRWLEGAYLGGRYPRQRFGDAFALFTPRARTAARRDLGRTTNARISGRIEGVTPTRIGLRIDLLEAGGRAVTGTAHVDVRFRTEGTLARTYRVGGRLMMTRHQGRWRVFAYDVARGRVDGGAPRPDRPTRKRGKRSTNGGRA